MTQSAEKNVSAFFHTQARFIGRISISTVSNAIQTSESNHIIIYCLNCIRHGRNATYELGLSYSEKLRNVFEIILDGKM